MSNTQERNKQRRQYLKEKGAAYTKMSLIALVSASVIALLLVFAATLFFYLGSGIDSGRLVFILLFGGVLLPCFGIIAWQLMHMARQAHQDIVRVPYVPPVTANTLPVEEVLVRGSEQPVQEQSKVLLRGTDGSAGTGEQEL